jgi:uncharacterized membrane-anchored protein
MRFPTRRNDQAAPPAGSGTVRMHRNFRSLLERVQEGDIVVIDRRDLDAAAARALLDRKPFAVLNATEFISGRFANLGPAILADAGVTLLEGDAARVRALGDGTLLRLDGSTLYDDAAAVALDVHVLTSEDIDSRMEEARVGLASQLDSFAHTSSEFLRREEGLLLHGTGLPTVRTDMVDKVVVIVGPEATVADLKRLRRFVREQRPVLIGVDDGVELLVRRRKRPDLMIFTANASPSDKALRRGREVVLHGAREGVRRQVEKVNLPAHPIESGAAATDVALLLAHQGGARLVVPTGAPASLEEFIDRERSDQASSVLTRLRLGDSLVEASAVPLLYTGRVRIWHLAVVVLAAAAVLALTIAATPIGNEWWHDLSDHFPGWLGGDR